MSASLKRPLFSYATEDFAVLEASFPMQYRERVLCISSGGETMLNFVALGAQRVTVVDNSFPQLALARVKLLGLLRLPTEQFHALLGLPSAVDPIAAFAAIRDDLPDADQRYWKNGGFLRNGALWCGSLARYFAISRHLLRFAIGKKRFNRLLAITDANSAEDFVEELFTLCRVKLLLRLLLHPAILQRFYPDKGWKSLDLPNTPKTFCVSKLKALITNGPLINNPVVYPYLHGDFPENLWPPYFRAAFQFQPQSEVASVDFIECDLKDIPSCFSEATFTGLAICNIVDWLSPIEMRDLMTQLRIVAAPRARLLMYSRTLSVKDGRQFAGTSWSFANDLSLQLTHADRTGYHSAVFLFVAQ